MIQLPAHQRGLTLIEILIALIIFTLLGILTYRGTAEILLSREQLEQEMERWRQIERSFNIVESELLQIASPYPVVNNPRAAALISLDNPPGIRFLTLAGNGVERVEFRLIDGTLHWRTWPEGTANPALSSDETLLDHLDGARWRFFSPAGWEPQWPSSEALVTDTIPYAIELEIDLPGHGKVSRLYALR